MGVILGDGSEGINFPVFWLVFLFVPPLLTMRLFAEERGTGTMEMLMTAPVKDWQIVFAKFVACFAFYLLMWLPTVAVSADPDGPEGDVGPRPRGRRTRSSWPRVSGVAVLGMLMMPFGFVGRGFLIALVGGAIAAVGGYLHCTQGRQAPRDALTAGIDPWPVLTSYIGVVAAGVMFLSLGLFVSSLVKGQMIAALIVDHAGHPVDLAGAVPAGHGSVGLVVQDVRVHHGPVPLRQGLHARRARHAAPGLLPECGVVVPVPDGAERGIAAR